MTFIVSLYLVWCVISRCSRTIKVFSVHTNSLGLHSMQDQHTQKHMYNICTTSVQRLRSWPKIVQMFYKCVVFAGELLSLNGDLRVAYRTHCRVINTLIMLIKGVRHIIASVLTKTSLIIRNNEAGPKLSKRLTISTNYVPDIWIKRFVSGHGASAPGHTCVGATNPKFFTDLLMCT